GSDRAPICTHKDRRTALGTKITPLSCSSSTARKTLNMYPHRIRLRGPWECEPLAWYPSRAPAGAQVPPPPRMKRPCHWNEGGLPGFAGRARFRRRFGYPGRIDTHERVWLTFAAVADTAEVRLNGTFLGTGGREQLPFEFEVTALLQDRNEMVVDVE